MAGEPAEKLKERRQHNRLTLRDGVFAMLPCDGIVLHEVSDMSLGGLRFWCLADDELPTDGFSVSLLTGEGLFLGTISAKTIWTASVATASPPPPQCMRQCGLEFEETTPEQLSRLHAFIESQGKDNRMVRSRVRLE